MENLTSLEHCRRDSSLASEVARGAREHELRLSAEMRLAALRQAIRPAGLGAVCEGVPLESLWLVTHRGLRRAGFRYHPASHVVLASWRGEGLVLVRPPGERRSVPLVAWEAPREVPGARYLMVQPGVPYDTLADGQSWHLLAFHSRPAPGLVRVQETPAGWVEFPEEEPS